MIRTDCNCGAILGEVLGELGVGSTDEGDLSCVLSSCSEGQGSAKGAGDGSEKGGD